MKNNEEQIPKPPKVVVSPVNMLDLTKGKEYNVVSTGDFIGTLGYQFCIIDNAGDILACIENNCCFIKENDWIIKEREQ
jgi:hypothetical protein